jgi:hypothetical protein
VNLAWLVVVALFAFLRVVVPILILLAPLLALPTAVLMRLAVAAARDRSPSWSMATAELGRLAGRKLLLGAAQLLVLALGVINVLLAGSIGGFLGIVSALIAAYAVIAAWMYSVALWPIVCDPDREMPLRDQLRVALTVVILRPLQIGVLALIAALAVIVCVQLIAPAVFLPGFVLVVIAGYVVPLVDRLRPMDDQLR